GGSRSSVTSSSAKPDTNGDKHDPGAASLGQSHGSWKHRRSCASSARSPSPTSTAPLLVTSTMAGESTEPQPANGSSSGAGPPTPARISIVATCGWMTSNGPSITPGPDVVFTNGGSDTP